MSASNEVRAAYSGAAGAWAAGPKAMYRRLAQPLVTHCPIPLARARVLDAGTGAGATSMALAAAGADVVAADGAVDMLIVDRRNRPPGMAADVLRLPVPGGVFDVAVAAFVLSHLDAPAAGLTELCRVVHSGGAVLAVGFSGAWEYAGKAVVEEVLEAFGFRRPNWYAAFKGEWEPRTGSPDALAATARAAGLADVDVKTCSVDTRIRSADDVISWRLGHPAIAPFVAALTLERRAALLDALRERLGSSPAPVVPDLLVLVARRR